MMKLTKAIHIARLSPKHTIEVIVDRLVKREGIEREDHELESYDLGQQVRIMQKTGGRFRDRLQQEGGTGQPPDPACRVTSASPSYSPIRSSQAAA